jgi:hypothetical protein
MAIAGGEGGGVERLDHVSAHLWVAGIGSGRAVAVVRRRQCSRHEEERREGCSDGREGREISRGASG